MRRMSDIERLATVETEIKSVHAALQKLQESNIRIENKLDNWTELFLPRRESEDKFRIRDEQIAQNKSELVRVETETKADLNKLEVRIETEIARVDKDLENFKREVAEKAEDDRIDRRRNRPHWFLVGIGLGSLAVSMGALIYALIKG